MALRLTRIALQIAVDESMAPGQDGSWLGEPEVTARCAYQSGSWSASPELRCTVGYQSGTWEAAPELRATYRVEKAHLTRIALQIAVDESLGADQYGSWSASPELQCTCELLAATSEWAGAPELRCTCFALPPGNHPDGWQGDPELYAVVAVTASSPQFASW